jgi:endonuclease/exonuclease/phosphatase (EEP) superfamily protein YafD
VNQEEPKNHNAARRGRTRAWGAAATISLALSTALVPLLSIAYGSRADGFAAITVFPVWAWLVPGGMLLLPAFAVRRRSGTAVAVVWLLYFAAFTDELRSLVPWQRSLAVQWEAGPQSPRTLRIISLNCGSGSLRAVEEVAKFKPDLVLLQESPGRDQVNALAETLFGEDGAALHGGDTALIAPGAITPRKASLSSRGDFVQARVQLVSGGEMEVVSLRLLPPLVRFDLWSPDCWRAQAENRRQRRAQLQRVAAQLAAVPASVPIIVGGDFNAPAGDAIFELLRPRLHDTFEAGGSGWCNTITNDYPFHRIDQVWTSSHFLVITVVGQRTEHSDHRMVISDVWLPGEM